MAVSLELVIEKDPLYFMIGFNKHEKVIIENLLNHFILHSEGYFSSKNKINTTGLYTTNNGKSAFSLEDQINLIDVPNYILLNAAKIKKYISFNPFLEIQYSTNHFFREGSITGRDVLLLSEMAEIPQLKKWLQFDTVCTLLNIQDQKLQIDFAKLSFRKQFNPDFALDVYRSWQIHSDFFFTLLHFFYEQLPNQFVVQEISSVVGQNVEFPAEGKTAIVPGSQSPIAAESLDWDLTADRSQWPTVSDYALATGRDGKKANQIYKLIKRGVLKVELAGSNYSYRFEPHYYNQLLAEYRERKKMSENYTVDDIGLLLGLHRNSIMEWIRKGTIKAEKISVTETPVSFHLHNTNAIWIIAPEEYVRLTKNKDFFKTHSLSAHVETTTLDQNRKKYFVNDIASLLEIHPASITRLIRDGYIKAHKFFMQSKINPKKINFTWIIYQEEYDRLRIQREELNSQEIEVFHKTIGVKEVADLLSLDRQIIYRYLRSGFIKAEKIEMPFSNSSATRFVWSFSSEEYRRLAELKKLNPYGNLFARKVDSVDNEYQKNYQIMREKRLREMGIDLKIESIQELSFEDEKKIIDLYFHQNLKHAFEALCMLYAPVVTEIIDGNYLSVSAKDKQHFIHCGLFFGLSKMNGKINGTYTQDSRNELLHSILESVSKLSQTEIYAINWKAVRLDARIYSDHGRLNHEKILSQVIGLGDL